MSAVPRRPWIIAHRGACLAAPENTVPAILRAAELGADLAEVDAQLTADGQVVLMHDATVARTTSGRGRVGELTCAQLRELDAGYARFFGGQWRGAQVPTLAEALVAAKEHGIGLAVELKAWHPAPALVAAAVAAVRDAGMLERCWFWSFPPQNLATVGELTDVPARGALSLGLPCREARAHAELVVPYAGHLLQLDAGLARRLGQPLVIWTINQPRLAARLARRGAFGLITNRPERLRRLFAAEARPYDLPPGRAQASESGCV
jgi:glycerophosphoryl diester phosphodiesterase